MIGVGRRTLLRGGLVLAAMPVVGSAVLTAGAAPASATGLQRAVLQTHLGSTVRLVRAGVPIAATVVEVADLPHAPVGSADAFSLLLRRQDTGEHGPGTGGLMDLALPDGTTVLIGAVPVGPEDGRLLQAVVDRRSPADLLAPAQTDRHTQE